MVLFVTMVVLAVAGATAVTTGVRHRRRAIGVLALIGVALWSGAAAGLGIMSGVHPLMLALVGAPLAYAVHDLTRRALTTRAYPGRTSVRRPLAARLLAAARGSNRREPLHWSVPAAFGTAATALEGYWAYQHLVTNGGVFSDLGALAGFTVLATLTVGLTGSGCLALHMHSTHRSEQPTVALNVSELPTVAFAPLHSTTGGNPSLN
jgi:hypothetical protein